jgi:cell division protein FtsW (lipid II flippase)
MSLVPLLVYGLCLAGVHLALVLTRFRGDQTLVAVVAFLAGFGLLAQYRMGAYAVDVGGVAPALYLVPGGFVLMLGTALAFADGRYRVLARGLWLWAGLSLLLVAVLLVTGQRFRGAVYALGFTTPTEVLKVTVVLGLAAWLDRQGRALARWHPRLPLPPWRELWPLLAFWTVLTALLALQRDLGMMVILSIALVALLVSATGRIGYLVYALLAAGGLGTLLLTLFEHGQRRIEAWRDPFQDPTGDGWQTLQALSGMYAGGLWGEGLGNGSPELTPIAGSDFIYSVIGEELGFLGCVAVLLFFLLLLYRALVIAEGARTDFGRLLAAGLTAVLAAQTLLNVGGVTKAIPLTGITLPFISHGGASLLTAFVAVGLLLAVSDGQTTSKVQAKTQVKAQVKAQVKTKTPRAPKAAPAAGGPTPATAPAPRKARRAPKSRVGDPEQPP